MRKYSIPVLMLLAFCLAAGDATDPLRRPLADYDASVNKLSNDFQTAIDKANDKFSGEVDFVLKAAMKGGDLKRANEISDFKIKRTNPGIAGKVYAQIIAQCHFNMKFLKEEGQRPVAFLPFGQLDDEFNKTSDGYQPYWFVRTTNTGQAVVVFWLPEFGREPVFMQVNVPEKGELTALMFDNENSRRNVLLLPAKK